MVINSELVGDGHQKRAGGRWSFVNTSSRVIPRNGRSRYPGSCGHFRCGNASLS